MNKYSKISDLFNSLYNGSEALGLSLIICFVLSICLGIIMVFTFLHKKNEDRYTGFGGWLYNFLNFKKLFTESLLRCLYLISAFFVSLSAIANLIFGEAGSIESRLFTFILYILIGNVLLRVIYEFLIVNLIVCRNTTEINMKMKDNNDSSLHIVQPEKRVMRGSNKSNQVPGVVFCRNCGSKFDAGRANCPNCGYARNQ